MASQTAQPFLNEAQRAALDAALAAKAAEAQKAAKARHHKPHDHERKSRAKGTGQAKKGGGGGKFTWGDAIRDGQDAVSSLDRNDPNYDSEDEDDVRYRTNQKLQQEVMDYKTEVLRIVEEYFDSGDISNVAESLEELQLTDYSYYFIKRLIATALDRKNRERELASILISSLYAEAIPTDQLQKGFKSLVDSIDDLVLDVPDAVDLVSLFLARAVIDDALPPAFVSKIPEVEGSLLVELKRRAEGHLSARHSAEKVLRCWGGQGVGLTYSDTKDSIAKMLEEYLDSFDEAEAARVLRNLSVPFFHHEVVKQALNLVLSNPSHQQPIVSLLARLSSSGEISAAQLSKGFQRVADNLEDTALDNPQAPEIWPALVEAARAAKLVGTEFEPSLRNSSAMSTTSQNGVHNSHSVQAYKMAIKKTIQEYLMAQDTQEVARRLAELDEPGLQHLFVKAIVIFAADSKEREKELTSQLLSDLHPDVISDDQMSMGFTRLLGAVDDFVLDCPDAVHCMSMFLGRAIVDEVLPPSFLTQVLPHLRDDSLGVSVVQTTGALLAARHAAERFTNCWHGGALSLEATRETFREALKEYVVSGDVAEASKCISELAVPHYHHEVVKQALELGFEEEASFGRLMALLKSLGTSGEVSLTQMTKGFQRIKAGLDDLVLDYPHAPGLFGKALEQATSEGWLSADLNSAAADTATNGAAV